MRFVIAVLLWWGMSSPVAYAAVTISEIAWMGDSTSANYEWIELYNSGETIAVDGWVLTDGANLTITLSGTVGGGAYVVLERNRADGQYQVNPPFVTYTGALVNTGTTLTLRRTDGSTADVVSGGTNWESVGGNNTTKETAQYTAIGWRTGSATPGRANITTGTIPGTPSATTTSTSTPTETTPTKSGGGGGSVKVTTRSSETVRLVIPNAELSLTPDVQSTGYVNQLIPFSVKPAGLGETWHNSLRYTWNFGDMSTTSGRTVSHRYVYPGTYVVTVEAVFGRYRQIAQMEITILPVTLSLARGSAGEVHIHNNAPYDIDVSGYTVASTKSATFPPRSILGPKSTVTIAPGQLGDSYFTRIWLSDNYGQKIATWPADTVPASPDTAAVHTTAVSPVIENPAVVSVTADASTANPEPAAFLPLLPTAMAAPATLDSMPDYVLTALEAESISDTPVTRDLHWSYGVLALIMLVATFGLLASRGKVSSATAEMMTDQGAIHR